MELKVFAIYDSKVGVFRSLMVYSHAAQATRAFQTAVNTVDTELNTYPGDFALYQIGLFDEDSGELRSEKDFVVNAVSLLNGKQPGLVEDPAQTDLEDFLNGET